MHNIMIVDDHPPIRIAIRAFLSQDPDLAVTHEVDNGVDALNLLRTEAIDLIILDIDIPKGDGFRLLKRIRQEGLPCKVLFLSAMDEGVYAVRAGHAGANGYISKTREMDQILNAVKTILAGYVFFPAEAVVRLYERPVKSADAIDEVSLTDREMTVLRALAKGLSNKQIGKDLNISDKTVSTYKTKLLDKLGVASIIDLAEYAKNHHLI